MAYPQNPYPASYKIYDSAANGGEGAWIEYYFRTSADLVGETGPYNGDDSFARKFVTNTVYVNGVAFAFSNLSTSGATAEVTITGANIVGSASAPSSGSLSYITANDTIATALGKLDAATKTAYDHIPDNIVVSDEYGNVHLDGDLYFDGSGIIASELSGYGAQMQFLNTGGQYKFFGNGDKTKQGILKFSSLTANEERTYTFPDASGTVALQEWVSTSYVPYQNAAYDVNLNGHQLVAGRLVTGNIFISDETENNNIKSFIRTSNTPLFIAPDTKLYYGSESGTNDANEVATHGWVSNAYVPTTRTVNSKALTGDIAITSEDIGYSGPGGGQQMTVREGIDLAIAMANGNAQSYAISDENPSGSGWANSQFASTAETITFDSNAGNNANMKLQKLDGSTVYIYDLKVGDTIFISQTDIPDRWLGSKVSISGSTTNFTFTFYKLETYNMQWSAISGKPTTIAGYGITDASINTTSQTITLGNNSISPVVQVQIGQNGSALSPSNGVVTLPAYPDVSGFVPYENATDDVNLGANDLIADGITATNSSYWVRMGYSGFSIGFQDNQAMTLNLPAYVVGATRTLATTDDLSSYIPLSGTNNLSGSIIPAANTTVNLGSGSNLLSNIYATSIRGYGQLPLIAQGSNTYTAYCDGVIKLGATNAPYANIYFPEVNSGDHVIALTEQVPIVTVSSSTPSTAKTGDIWIQVS